MQPDAYEVESYTYNYHSEYGSEEILTRRLQIKEVVPMEDRIRSDWWSKDCARILCTRFVL